MTFWDKLHAFPKGIQWSPYGERIPIGHLFGEGATGIWKTGLSLNRRWVERITCPLGHLHIWRMRRRKGVKLNRLPRGSKRRTGATSP